LIGLGGSPFYDLFPVLRFLFTLVFPHPALSFFFSALFLRSGDAPYPVLTSAAFLLSAHHHSPRPNRPPAFPLESLVHFVLKTVLERFPVRSPFPPPRLSRLSVNFQRSFLLRWAGFSLPPCFFPPALFPSDGLLPACDSSFLVGGGGGGLPPPCPPAPCHFPHAPIPFHVGVCFFFFFFGSLPLDVCFFGCCLSVFFFSTVHFGA